MSQGRMPMVDVESPRSSHASLVVNEYIGKECDLHGGWPLRVVVRGIVQDIDPNTEFGNRRLEEGNFKVHSMITGTSQADCTVLIIDSTTSGFEAGFSKDGQTHKIEAQFLKMQNQLCGVVSKEMERDNVRNQRENVILLLSEEHIKLLPKPEPLNKAPTRATRSAAEEDTLYGFYLLIWGEATNVRFIPECLCYIFNNMAHELHGLLVGNVIIVTGENIKPSYGGDDEAL
ncbi:hypothetical protein IFM89_032344 [Coptis chinensis]|uniref:1,3-beta-glucan synthase component FKS1-like domain-containing protein n=1 Tax=Coptis chinensis TaxID=261450 RepID=A0A835IFM5_9MAGN|nr:hypothetical protein IFM89_032344 [Coptis chinensis]